MQGPEKWHNNSCKIASFRVWELHYEELGPSFEVISAKEGIQYPIQGKGNYPRTLVFRIPETLESLTFKRGVGV